jgi:hypothetical protein
MGVNVANLALGGIIRSYSDPANLQVALRATLVAQDRERKKSVLPGAG